MDTRKIRKLIELVKETGIGELEVTSGEESVRINCQINVGTPSAPQAYYAPPPAAAPTQAALTAPTAPAAPIHEGHKIKSPMVGTVYLAPTPGAKPFVSVGQRIEIGDTLCLIEAMKMFNKIESDVAGVLSARLIENGSPLEYDQPMFIIDTGE